MKLLAFMIAPVSVGDAGSTDPCRALIIPNRTAIPAVWCSVGPVAGALARLPTDPGAMHVEEAPGATREGMALLIPLSRSDVSSEGDDLRIAI